ncbi:carnitine dehydratase [Zobellella denitrificans]|jgi:aldehyde dehydrogenase (NAD+)|uniref:Carnitine dehydratase n=1 Tax=Zobellella denitrificans TaxID=347534 RepID=A0A231N227_9GAMM|nr:aldehyde dehydrogenase [Zobellella denitrificans]ATG73818.1 carnitine dehydratase [Zobellella denitrificans]OXS16554.1 carnitine dehydratase [Zobellella denitrificans]
MQQYRMYIDGRWVESLSGEWFESSNPYTGLPWARIPRGNGADVDCAVAAAARALQDPAWRGLTASGRGELLRRLGDALADRADFLAGIEVRDNGKLYAEMRAQTHYLRQWYYYYGGLADKIEGAVIPTDKAGHFNYTRHEPVGVVAAIIPWNSPLLLASWKLAPALAAGNTVVFKPSEYTSASLLEFARIVERVGFPPGVLNVVTGFGAEVGAPLVEHPQVAKVAFTGSDQTGRQIYQAAARGMKRVTMELGGKSPNIVFADARQDNAVKGVISGIFAASGQTCVAGSRLLVQRAIHDEFVDKLLAFARHARLGDPMSPDTQVGPVTNLPQLEKILGYIDIARAEGADCLLGGGRPDTPGLEQGWFVEPTIFAGVHNRMRIAREEVFGPVLSIIPFEDEEEAVAIANDSPYGLAAGIWTEDLRRALTLPDRLEAGTVWVNTYRTMSYLTPFGGFKQSGLGKESGQDSLREYLKVKSVWLSTTEDVPDPFVIR